jgi:hypothetical protein
MRLQKLTGDGVLAMLKRKQRTRRSNFVDIRGLRNGVRRELVSSLQRVAVVALEPIR